jgi:hypothetical protein
MRKLFLGALLVMSIGFNGFAASSLSKKEASQAIENLSNISKYEINNIKTSGSKGTIYFTAIFSDMGDSPLNCTLGMVKFEGKWNSGGLNCSNH